jgi:hypothetical protein
MERMPDDEPTPFERTGLPSLDDIYATFKTLATDEGMRHYSAWYDSLLSAPPPKGGNRRHLFMAAFTLARQVLVTDHAESTSRVPGSVLEATMKKPSYEDEDIEARLDLDQEDIDTV